MVPGVISDQMSGPHCPPYQFRLGFRARAHEKERRVQLMARQKVQQPWRPRRIRPVVESQRQLARPLRRSEPSPNNREPGHSEA
jgi:hypothetical protein